MSTIEFNPLRRFVRPIGDLIWRVSQVADLGDALKQSIKNVGQRHDATERLKADVGISSVIVEWQFAGAIERVQLALSKLKTWRSKVMRNEGSGASPLLTESLHLLTEADEGLRASTLRRWFGNLVIELGELTASIEKQMARSEALISNDGPAGSRSVLVKRAFIRRI